MTGSTNFKEAHRRHWVDAELLYSNERWGNADHLFGFSAECGLKAVMVHLGLGEDTPNKKYRKHVKDLWTIFSKFANEGGGKEYLRELPSDEPFKDWSHNDRYSASGFSDTEAVKKHRAGADGIRRMVELLEQSRIP